MAQVKDEIKMKYAVSRDFQKTDVETLARFVDQKVESKPAETSRRDFFKSIIPATGKALTGFLRTMAEPAEKEK